MVFSSDSAKKAGMPDDSARRVIFLDTDAEWNNDTAQNLCDAAEAKQSLYSLPDKDTASP